jgi:hypothetical protein
MKSPYRADLETILHGQYVPGEPLARVMLGDADEFAVIQIADKYSKRRLLRTAKEFLHLAVRSGLPARNSCCPKTTTRVYKKQISDKAALQGARLLEGD